MPKKRSATGDTDLNVYRDEYARAGFQMLPVLDPSGRRTGRPNWRRTMRTPVRRAVVATAVVVASALALLTAGGVLGRRPATVSADSTV